MAKPATKPNHQGNGSGDWPRLMRRLLMSQSALAAIRMIGKAMKKLLNMAYGLSSVHAAANRIYAWSAHQRQADLRVPSKQVPSSKLTVDRSQDPFDCLIAIGNRRHAPAA